MVQCLKRAISPSGTGIMDGTDCNCSRSILRLRAARCTFAVSWTGMEFPANILVKFEVAAFGVCSIGCKTRTP